MRYIRCFLIMFSTSDDTIKSPGAMSYFQRIPTTQNTVLSYYSTYMGNILPYYFVAFITIYGSEDVGTLAKSLWPQLQQSLEQLDPTPLFFLGSTHRRAASGSTRYLYCWFCPRKTKWIAFDCSETVACPGAMTNKYWNAIKTRKTIPWLYSNSIPTKSAKFCPFTLKQNETCVLDEAQRVLRFLIHDSNWTNIESGETFPEIVFTRNKLPLLTYSRVFQRKHPYKYPYLFFTGETATTFG